jgi:hypothetical protein
MLMKDYKFVVEIPAIEASEGAYNPKRPISSLLLHQLRHLHAVEQQMPEKDQTGINITTLHTEVEASDYIRKVTKKLQARSVSQAGKTATAKKKSFSRKKKIASGSRRKSR